MPFDYEHFLGALPETPLLPVKRRPTKIASWDWPALPGYNGFTGSERIDAWRFSKWLQEAGCLPWPKVCDICSAPGQSQYHSENYYDPTSMAKLCKPCHMALHRRFDRSKAWKSLVDQHARSEHDWFAQLPTEHTLDVAAFVRGGFAAENVADLYSSTLFRTPRGLAPPPMIFTNARAAPAVGEHRFVAMQVRAKTVGIQSRSPSTATVKVRHRSR